MRPFEPLQYALGTSQKMIAIILVALLFSVPDIWYFLTSRTAIADQAPYAGLALVENSVMIVWLYCVGSITFGQIFGQCYSFSRLWPTLIILGVVIAGLAIMPGVLFPGGDDTADNLLLGFGVLWIGTSGILLPMMLWAFPRICRALGIVKRPHPWGVRL